MTNYRCERSLDSLALYDRGDAWLCCPDATEAPLGNVLRGDSLLELWRGPRARQIRECIRRGDFSRCVRCPHLPAPCGPVQETTDKAIPKVDRIPMLSVSHDRACNLRCPTCRKETPPPRDDVHLLYDYLLDSGVLAEVDSLRLLGSGEPFASFDCREFLKNIPWKKYPLLRVHLQTNGILLTPDRYHILGEATERIEEISVSVDAYHSRTYAENRSRDPAAFPSLKYNIEYAHELLQTKKISRLTLVFVVQKNNFREMIHFANWAISIGARARFLRLHNWGTFTDDEYRTRAVHLPEHPDYAEYERVCAHPIFSNPNVIKTWR